MLVPSPFVGPRILASARLTLTLWMTAMTAAELTRVQRAVVMRERHELHKHADDLAEHAKCASFSFRSTSMKSSMGAPRPVPVSDPGWFSPLRPTTFRRSAEIGRRIDGVRETLAGEPGEAVVVLRLRGGRVQRSGRGGAVGQRLVGERARVARVIPAKREDRLERAERANARMQSYHVVVAL
jgi:hypothetical protein